MDETKLRDDICRFGKSMFDRGLTAGSSGNISVKTKNGWLVTPTNASLGNLDPAKISELDQHGRLISGDKPTKEVPLHTAMYDTVANSGAIVHLHSVHSVAVSMLPETDPDDVLPPLTAYYVMRVGRTALVPYHMPGDPNIGDAIRGLAGKYTSVLLANHGPVMAGKTLESAVYATEELEETSRLHLLTRGLNPRTLTTEQISALTKIS